MYLRIGFSFMTRNKDKDVRYWYTCHAEAVYSSFVQNEKEVSSFIEALKNKRESHHLEAITKSNIDGPFEESSISVYKLVAATFWITK